MFRTLRGQYFIGSFIIFVAMLSLLLWIAHEPLGQATGDRFAAGLANLDPFVAIARNALAAPR